MSDQQDKKLKANWQASPEAIENVKRVLEQTGIPLETRVARVCDNYDMWFKTVRRDSTFSSGRILYGTPGINSALREVDQCVTMSVYIDLDPGFGGENLYIGTSIEIAIECKHRNDLAVFAFPYQQPSRYFGYPTISDLVGTSFLGNIETLPSSYKKYSLCTITTLDNVPKAPRVYDEQLLYKASASLYDYIQFEAKPFLSTEPDKYLQETGLLERFSEYANKLHSISRDTAREWLHKNVDANLRRQLYEVYAKNWSQNIPWITFYVPIICLDAPIYSVEMDDDGAITTIDPIDFAMTSLRLPNWPGALSYSAVSPRAEALALISTIEALPDVLETHASWFSRMIESLNTRESETVEWIGIEMMFFQSIRDILQAREPKDVRVKAL